MTAEIAVTIGSAELSPVQREKRSRYEEGGLAKNTRRNYAYQLTTWLTYADEQGVTRWATAETMEPWFASVKNFLTLRAEQVRASTVSATVQAMRHEATVRGDAFSLTVLRSPQLQSFLAGIGAAEIEDGNTRLKQAPPFTHAQLDAVYLWAKREGTVQALRDAALFAVGLATGLRADNLIRLTVADVERAISHEGYNLFLNREKTRQRGEGRYVSIRPADGSLRHRDPVVRLATWLEKYTALIATGAGAEPVPLFPQTLGANALTMKPLSNSQAVSRLVRSVLVKSGAATVEEAARFSSHSFRSTHITWSLAAGISQADVSVITGHKSLAMVARYNRRAVEEAAHTDYLGGA